MKWLTIAILVVVAVLGVVATPYPMCEGKKEIVGNCTMLTPTLTNCTTYAYTVVNLTGHQIENESLSNFSYSRNIYQLNFTQGPGDYIITLCDGTTREIRVKGEDDGKMILGILTLLPMIFAFLLIWSTMQLNPEALILKKFLWLLVFVFFLMSINLGMDAFSQFYDIPAFEDAMITYSFWISLLFYAAILGLFFMIVWDSFQYFGQKRRKRYNPE